MLCYDLQKISIFFSIKSIWCNTQQPRQRPRDARSRDLELLQEDIFIYWYSFPNWRDVSWIPEGGLWNSSSKLRDFCKWKSVVVRLSAFQGHSLIIKALDFTTYPCRRLFATSPVKESISFWWMLSGRSRQHFKIRSGVFCIRRMCENIFGALEIVGAQLKEKRK